MWKKLQLGETQGDGSFVLLFIMCVLVAERCATIKIKMLQNATKNATMPLALQAQNVYGKIIL